MANASISKQQSIYRVVDQTPAHSEHFLKFGYVCHMMSGFASHQTKTVNYAKNMIRPAIKNGQIKLYFDADGGPVGYVVWAYLADETIARIEQTGKIELHPSEFNEGDKLWIVDFLLAPGRLAYVLADLCGNAFSETQECWFLRMDGAQTHIRHLKRSATPNKFLLSKKLVTALPAIL